MNITPALGIDSGINAQARQKDSFFKNAVDIDNEQNTGNKNVNCTLWDSEDHHPHWEPENQGQGDNPVRAEQPFGGAQLLPQAEVGHALVHQADRGPCPCSTRCLGSTT